MAQNSKIERTDHPILFSAPMVRALLDGKKTQTRRLIKPQPAVWTAGVIDITEPFYDEDEGGWGQVRTDWSSPSRDLPMGQPEREVWVPLRCRYGKPGDRLWVRETWAHYQTVNHIRRQHGGAFSEISDGLAAYRADGYDSVEDLRQHIHLMSGADLEAVEINGDRWRPSIHMPRWASRLTLTITEVRVQKLQNISTKDAKAEGALWGAADWMDVDLPISDPRVAFAALWDKINGPGAWDANPTVIALSFTVERKNIDAR